ncbi:MAG: hypothetical protein KA191_14295 [Verrucomicrobia bacterium]|jgi:hypothetical protein|nr:hypothetical protein [Verrucomicrobiota bacterium]OQC67601.1 MAG: hypothetical protein BWX48_00634 [Verrucomicrobia bacterium ADurb.Bin006]MDI9381453.1 DUF6298 domain-containing protein [Verrucomicrobiota bacterium]NMD21733.1 hypothetical protein [Verrucomicrobiota bacterium]HOA61577.1 DUF6298 domain-containing protein [Verrucomicrobiota bacterium]
MNAITDSRTDRTCLLTLALLAGLALGLHSLPARATGLRAGIARGDITPTQPVMLAGCASRRDLFRGVHDPLSARALAFEQDGQRLVLVSIDNLGFYHRTAEPLRTAILEASGLKPAELFLCAIHTHSAPTLTVDVERGHSNNVAYTSTLQAEPVEVVRKALGQLAPAKISAGSGSSPVGVNRREVVQDEAGKAKIVLGRNPPLPTDREVQVLKPTQPPEHELVAVLFAYEVQSGLFAPGAGDPLPCFPAFQSAAAPAAGPLRIHPENPRYFTDGAKRPDGSLRAVYLTGSHTWNNLVDMGRSDPPEKFEWEAYLSFLERHHHNFIRLWAWDSTTWDTRANGALGKDFIHHVAPQPWARTGPGTALDGKPKFNLAEFNPEYFEQLRSRVKTAGDRGIYVSVMLFEGWGLFHGNRRRGTDDGWAWRSHPFNPANNIQALKVEGTDSFSGRVHTLRSPEVHQFQAAYVRKVVDSLNDLDNVLYEVINEGGEKEWNWWVIQTIHDYERAKPKQHPVGSTGHGAERLPTMLASPAEWVSPGRADGYAEDAPAWNENKVSLLDTDHIWGVGGNAGWVWKSFLRGHNPIFMDPCDGSVLGEDRGWESVRAAMGYARRVADRLNLAAMTPRNELASTGYCLACPGQEYLVYQPAGGKEFSLQLASGEYQLEWIDPSRPELAGSDRLSAEDGSRQFQAPFAGSAVLHLKARSQAGVAQERAPVHAVVDLGHQFTFYAE